MHRLLFFENLENLRKQCRTKWPDKSYLINIIHYDDPCPVMVQVVRTNQMTGEDEIFNLGPNCFNLNGIGKQTLRQDITTTKPSFSFLLGQVRPKK